MLRKTENKLNLNEKNRRDWQRSMVRNSVSCEVCGCWEDINLIRHGLCTNCYRKLYRAEY